MPDPLPEGLYGATHCICCKKAKLYGHIRDGGVPNYHYSRTFPGLCDGCVPAGVRHRAARRRVRGKHRRRVPRGFFVLRWCSCGRTMGPRQRMCSDCSTLARRETWRKEKERQRKCPTVNAVRTIGEESSGDDRA